MSNRVKKQIDASQDDNKSGKSQRAQVMVSARVNAAVKQSAQAIVESKGLTISSVFQSTLERIARTGEVPETKPQQKLSAAELRQRLKAFEQFSVPKPGRFSALTDDEIREMRLKEKYDLNFDA